MLDSLLAWTFGIAGVLIVIGIVMKYPILSIAGILPIIAGTLLYVESANYATELSQTAELLAQKPTISGTIVDLGNSKK